MAAALSLFLALWNNLANRVPGFQRAYVLVNVGLAMALLALAGRWELDREALGLGGDTLGRGLAVGGALAALVALAYGVALAVPRLRPLLRDARVADLSPRALAFGALVRVPLGTVLWEEVAFRSVLLAVWSAEQPLAVAVAVSSAVFGLWHVVPTLVLLDVNGVRGRRMRGRAVAGAVLATGLAGVGLCALRLLTGSLVAPALVHLATNSVGLIASSVATRDP